MGGALKLELHIDTPGPIAPGGTVSGRVLVVEGGKARSLAVRLAFAEWTEDYIEIASVAGETTLAEGDLTDGAVVPFSLSVPADALPAAASKQGSVGWQLRAHADRRTSSRSCRSTSEGPGESVD